MTHLAINEIDRVEILTLQDNYIELTLLDDNEIISRPLVQMQWDLSRSILSEHGFSAIVRATKNDATRTLLFDFGFSQDGALKNARALGAKLDEVEVLALSHGHMDHWGGLENLVKNINREDLELVVHPEVFRSNRYTKLPSGLKIFEPAFNRDNIEQLGVNIIATRDVRAILDGDVLFLGEINRKSDFEIGIPGACYEEHGVEKPDRIEDDTSIALNLKGRGLIVISGCAHSGIINSIHYARAVSGIKTVHAVMGGFHLSGSFFDPLIEPTIEELKKINPGYIIPCHCTGHKAVRKIEQAFGEKFILNTSGTKLTFSKP